VHREVVIDGIGLPGSAEVAKADWIVVKELHHPTDLLEAQQRHSLGAGELSTILLAKELRAEWVLLDDFKGRKLAIAEGLRVRGSIGLLEAFYAQGHLMDLRSAFQQLLKYGYVDQRLLDRRLLSLGLLPLSKQ
jgi:predicted nucleic acid-binding protein